jgi:transcriptional regulator with AAA-type ATPase domain
MPIFSEGEHRFLTSVSRLAYCNPFLPERTVHERGALGKDYAAREVVWSASISDPESSNPNVDLVHARLGPLIEKIRARAWPGADHEEVTIYEECVHHLLYLRYYPQFVAAAEAGATSGYAFFRNFAADWERYLTRDGVHFETASDAPHFFACFRQVQRAFHYIFDNIIGNSMPAATLRASVWQSVFTRDLRRYRRTLYARLRDFPTLVTGPSGTGKELVARAIAGSRYVPFDPAACRFADPAGETFLAVNLAALSPTLIESELFGHRRGAFTGAIGDRKGWLESCPATGSVFLDELGEMELSIQVKLLRVIEGRTFSRVGDTAVREFAGKLIAATNRDLALEIQSGRFREDLYYRLCADLIQTPSLREQIEDSPQVLQDLLLFMVRRAVGDEAERCLPEVEDWVRTNLPSAYSWPGNYRELEQCVRNVIIRGSYQPIGDRNRREDESFLTRFRQGELTADQVTSYYSALVYRRTGTYEETARRLGIDRRTAKSKVEAFLASTTTIQ